jgi:hemerythrin superfamily protein
MYNMSIFNTIYVYTMLNNTVEFWLTKLIKGNNDDRIIDIFIKVMGFI